VSEQTASVLMRGTYIRDTVSWDSNTLTFSLHTERGSWVDRQWVRHGERQDITHTMTQQQLHDMAVFDLGMRLPVQDAPPES
jgi:hypothetical protein